MKTVIVSGYFDPLHVGHIDYLEHAQKLGDTVWAIVNSDAQAALKKGRAFMHEAERMRVVGSIWCVNKTILAIDGDASVSATIRHLVQTAQPLGREWVFAKGGDRFAGEIPEAAVCRELGVEIRDGLGAKIQSSSALIAGAKAT